MFDFNRITLFYLEKRLSKHKMTIFSKHLGGKDPFALPLSTPMFATEFYECRSTVLTTFMQQSS